MIKLLQQSYSNPFEVAAIHDMYVRIGMYYLCLTIEKRAAKSDILMQLPYYKPIKKVPVFLLN